MLSWFSEGVASSLKTKFEAGGKASDTLVGCIVIYPWNPVTRPIHHDRVFNCSCCCCYYSSVLFFVPSQSITHDSSRCKIHWLSTFLCDPRKLVLVLNTCTSTAWHQNCSSIPKWLPSDSGEILVIDGPLRSQGFWKILFKCLPIWNQCSKAAALSYVWTQRWRPRLAMP